MSEERVISETVIGGADPISRKFRDMKNAISGIGMGIVAIIFGLGLVYFSVMQFKENSKVVEALPMQEASQLKDKQGMVKFHGVPTVTRQAVFDYTECFNKECTGTGSILQTVNNSLYFEAKYERFELVKEVKQEKKTVTKDGKDVEQTVEVTDYVEKWVEKGVKKEWSDFKIGEIRVIGGQAKMMLNYATQEIPNVFIPNANPLNNYGRTVSAEVGKTRVRISYIPKDRDLLVVGNIQNNEVKNGDTFIITDKGDVDLVNALKTEENTTRLIMRIAAWLLLTIGFGALMAPILELVEIIPLAGKAAKAVANFAGAVLAGIIVLMGVFILTYWYVILIVIALILGIGIFVVMKAMKK